MVARPARTRGDKHQTVLAGIIAPITYLGINADVEKVLIPVNFTTSTGVG